MDEWREIELRSVVPHVRRWDAAAQEAAPMGGVEVRRGALAKVKVRGHEHGHYDADTSAAGILISDLRYYEHRDEARQRYRLGLVACPICRAKVLAINAVIKPQVEAAINTSRET